MIKKNWKLLVITSLVILLPAVVGLFLWNALPESLPIHWNAAGEVDNYAPKALGVLGMPAFLLVLHWLCMLGTAADPKAKELGKKPIALVLWICPVISLMVESIVLAVGLGYGLRIEILLPLVFGALFVVIGNYMPKCRQNYSLGIKLPWTLDDEENWNKTHRLAGIVWTAGGVAVMATSLFGSVIVFFALMILMVLIPTVYSYLFYRKKK